MPTRTRASTLAAGIFGLSFILRAVADTTSEHWLLNVTPLGWIENLLPLVGSKPVWLVPVFGTTFILFALTVWIAGLRDLNASVFADHDTALPRTRLLNTPLQLAIRLTGMTTIAWFLAITASAFLYGSITKSIVQTLNGTKGFHKALAKLESANRIDIATLFLGVIYLILMVAIMAYVANAIGKVRDDEAQGYLDNFLVQPVSRIRWLSGRLVIISVATIAICFISSITVCGRSEPTHWHPRSYTA